MPGRLEFELPLGKPNPARKVARTGQPMRLLLLGNFGAQASAWAWLRLHSPALAAP